MIKPEPPEVLQYIMLGPINICRNPRAKMFLERARCLHITQKFVSVDFSMQKRQKEDDLKSSQVDGSENDKDAFR